MAVFLKFIEKVLSSVVLSLFLAFLTFSFVTGNFPPRKSDIQRALHLAKGLFSSTREYNEKAKNFDSENPNLEQVVEMQRLALKRSEMTLQLTGLLKRIPQPPKSEIIAKQLDLAIEHLNQAGQAIQALDLELQKLAEGK